MVNYTRKLVRKYSDPMVKLTKQLQGSTGYKTLQNHEMMQKGYESMAQINLAMSEEGLMTCIVSLRAFEENLNGDDKESEY